MNMAGKYTVTSPALETYEEFLPEIALVLADEGLSSPCIGNIFRVFWQNHPQTQDTRLRKQNDLQYITTNYLIRSIDTSFHTWENAPYYLPGAEQLLFRSERQYIRFAGLPLLGAVTGIVGTVPHPVFQRPSEWQMALE